MENRQHLINCFLLFFLALVIRLLIVSFHQFDGLYGQDAFAYYDFANGILYFLGTGNPPPPFFWSIGYPAQLAIGFGIFGTSTSVALGISILMGVTLPALVYILARQFNLRSPYAFFAGLLIAFSGQALQSSLVIMSDIPALFWTILSIICFLRYLDLSKRRWLILCGLCVPIACLTRWIYLIFPPLFLITLVIIQKKNIRLLDLTFAIIVGLLPAIPQVIFDQINPTPLLDHAWVQGWSVANFWSQDFINIDGTFHYEKVNAIFYAYPVYDLSYLSPLLSVFVVAGIMASIYHILFSADKASLVPAWIGLRHKILSNREFGNIILLLGWMILPYLFLSGIPYQNIRFALIIFPPIVIIIGFGLERLANLHHPIRWIFILLGLLGLFHTAQSGFDYANSFISLHQSEKEIVTWLDDKIPDDATLYTFGSTLTLEQYTDYNIIEIFYETPNTLQQRWQKGHVDYLLLNVWQIENQWQGRDPQANYHWFRDTRGLTVIDKFHNLTLFEVSA